VLPTVAARRRVLPVGSRPSHTPGQLEAVLGETLLLRGYNSTQPALPSRTCFATLGLCCEGLGFQCDALTGPARFNLFQGVGGADRVGKQSGLPSPRKQKPATKHVNSISNLPGQPMGEEIATTEESASTCAAGFRWWFCLGHYGGPVTIGISI
jgi:hypothetical protein